jgi:L-ascorbate metabolism protein UlaG (beta-lactamase superfamily)
MVAAFTFMAVCEAETSAARPDDAARVQNPAPADTVCGAGLDIEYLANEGVLLTSGDRRVVVDGLFGDGPFGYHSVPPARRDSLERGIGSFEGIDLVLVTHRHGDHFDPRAVGRHLVSNRSAILVAAPQVVDSLRSGFGLYGEVRDRIRAVLPDMGQSESVRAGGIRLQVLRLLHTSPRNATVENLGFIIEMGSRRVLHVGDAVLSSENFDPFRLDTLGIDVGLLPFWYLVEVRDRALVQEKIAPTCVVAVHVGREGGEGWERRIKRAMPEAIVFVRPPP